VASTTGGTIFGFRIDRFTGALTAVPGSPFFAPFPPVLMKAVGRFLLVGNADPSQTNSLAEFSIDPSTGGLTLTLGSNPLSAIFLPGRFFEGPTAQLNLNNTVVDSSGRLYISGRKPAQTFTGGDTNAIGSLTMDAQGNLQTVSSSPFAFQVNGAIASPGPLALDPAGRFLYAVMRACLLAACPGDTPPSNVLAAINRMGDGGLDAFAPGSPLTIAHFFLTSHDRCFTPSSLAIHPSGKFLYLDCPGDDVATPLTGGSGTVNSGRAFAIQAYQVDPNGGTFTLLETFDCCETLAILNGVLMQPQGNFLLALTQGVSVFSINQNTGFLTQVAGSPFALASGDFSTQLFPQMFTIDRTGSFVYIVRGSDLTVASFSLNASTGALTELPGTTASLGNGDTRFSMQVAQP